MKEDSDLQLSIIVPVYNVEKYIRACIESIFKQRLDENTFEVIIVNDGTKDRSMEVIQDIIDHTQEHHRHQSGEPRPLHGPQQWHGNSQGRIPPHARL